MVKGGLGMRHPPTREWELPKKTRKSYINIMVGGSPCDARSKNKYKAQILRIGKY